LATPRFVAGFQELFEDRREPRLDRLDRLVRPSHRQPLEPNQAGRRRDLGIVFDC